MLEVAPLAVIPYIQTAEDQNSKYGKRVAVVAVMIICILATLAAVHYFKTPLDVLWYVALRRFGIGV
jgi:succinoglycan biosynthesis transport protein ExoP